MELRSPTFEKGLRRRVRRTVRASRALRKQARRGRPPSWLDRSGGPVLGLLFITAYGVAGLVAVMPPGQVMEARLAVVTLWFLGLLSSSVGGVWQTLFENPLVPTLYHLPVADRAIGEHLWQRLWRRNGRWLLFWAPLGLALPAKANWTWTTGLAGAALIGLHYGCARALAVHGLMWGRGRGLRWLWAGFPAAIALAIALRWTGPLPAGVYEALNWTPVFGWLNYLYLHGVLGGDPWVFTLLIPISAVFWTLPFSKRRFLEHYQLGEPQFPPTAAEGDGWPAEEGEPRGPTAIADAVRSRRFLGGEAWWHDGWYERLAARFLNARERMMTEWLLADAPGWSATYRRAVKRWAVGMVIALLTKTLQPDAPVVNLLPLLPLLLCLNVVLPQPGGGLVGLKPHWLGGVAVPPFATVPLGYRELRRLLEKLCLLRFVTGWPLLLGTTLLGAWTWRETLSAPQVLLFLVKLSGIALAGLPLVAGLTLASPTNDTRRVRWCWLPVLLPLILVLLAGVVGVVGFPDWWGVLGGLAVIAVSSRVLCRLHGWAWKRGRFDLLVTGLPGE